MSEYSGWPSVCCDYGKEPEVEMKPIDITRMALRILGEKMKEHADVLWPTQRDIDFTELEPAYRCLDYKARIGDTVRMFDKAAGIRFEYILSTQKDLDGYIELLKNPTSGER